MRHSARFLRKGRVVALDGFDPTLTLLEYLRTHERACGTKEGCNEGDCGACTVVLARLRNGVVVHEPVNSCILLAAQADGADVIAIEDIGDERNPHPVQVAMVRHHGAQCGFCSPGIVMSLFALYQQAPRPVGRQHVKDALAGNLCRCTGYRPIVDAAIEACAGSPDDAFVEQADRRKAALAALQDDLDLFVGDNTRFFAAPRSIETLRALCGAHPDATLLAGGTDVGLWITKRLRILPKIIWLGRVAGLDEIHADAQEMRIGATATHAAAMPYLADIDPDLGELMRRFGSQQVRVSGTVGGNIANGSPIGDLAPALIALDARMSLLGPESARLLPVEAFFLDYGRQDRQPGEFVHQIVVPKLEAGRHFRAFKLSKRFDEDISAVMGAFNLALEADRVIDARIAFGGMAAIPKRALAAEAALADARLGDPASWEPGLAALTRDFSPISDARASAGYRLQGARALLTKALIELSGRPSRKTRLTGIREDAHV